jgi:DNA replication protein DnaC
MPPSLARASKHSTITSTVLDRLLHHAETVFIEGTSYCMKNRSES